MDPAELLDQVERAATLRESRALVRPHARTPGLSQAYFERLVERMGSDLETARSLATRWKVFADLGDEPSFAYRAKGGGERLSGKWLQSVASFTEAGRRATSKVDRLAFQVGSVDSLARVGRIDEAVALGKRLAVGLEKLGQRALAARVRLNTAAALLWVDRFKPAQAQLNRALPELQRAGLENESALCLMSLSTCSLLGGDPARARELADQAERVFTAGGQDHFARLCRLNVAQAQLQMGRADLALEGLIAIRDAVPDHSLELARVEEFLGDAYLRLNMPEEARHAFESALAIPTSKASPLNRANCHLGKSWAARQLGLNAESLREARRAERQYRAFGNEVWRHVAQIALAEALLQEGRYGLAEEIVCAAAASLFKLGAQFAQAEAHLAAAECRLAINKDPEVDLRKAQRLISRRGMQGLEWRLHFLRARTSARAKAAHFRRMHRAILRSRAEITSSLAKASLLRDKTQALGEYLDFLLERPTASRVSEALEVIRTTRAVALIDEALSSVGARSAELVSRLEALRSELENDGAGEDVPGSPVRRILKVDRGRAGLARRWHEWTIDMSQSLPQDLGPKRDAGSHVYAVTDRFVRSLHLGKVRRLCRTEDMRAVHRWLRFELFAPLADRHADASAAQDLLIKCRDLVWPEDGDAEAYPRLALDGALWGLPWPALVEGGSAPTEPILAMAPGFGSAAALAHLPEDPKVVLWGVPSPDLPHVSAEIEILKGTFRNVQHLESAAEIRDFIEDGLADLLHVAGHARLNAHVPMFSYLEFPDGRVHAFEIARCEMRCGLVTLSACDTGALSLLNHSEPQGLVRSFLARRAKAVLASLWMLDDEAALQFASLYNVCLSRGCEVGAAVSKARSKVRERMPHPYFWAPLVLFGGYEP